MADDRLTRFRPLNEEVLYPAETIVEVDRRDIEALVARAQSNARKRIRICAHPDAGDPLHEMLIVHTRETYVRPHKHLGKSESFHIIEGQADVVIFDDDGKLLRVISMGEAASGATFYYRLRQPCYHALLVRSAVLVFHEVTNGPFAREGTLFAPWAPGDGEAEAVRGFVRRLLQDVNTFKENLA